MAFGLTNAPTTFQTVNREMHGRTHFKRLSHFLDDIVVFSETFEEHISRLEAVFSHLQQHGLKLKVFKCQLFKDRVTYLGHVVNSNGIKTDPDKLAALAT